MVVGTGADRHMVNYVTYRIHSTSAYTWISTLLVKANPIVRAVTVNYALWIQTFGAASNVTTYAISSTWGWITGILWCGLLTFNEWITNHVAWTGAYGAVVNRITDRSVTTHSRTRVDTLLIDTCFVSWTIRVNCTLRVTSSTKWCSLEVGKTFADSISIRVSANRIQSAW